jgi:hypothetical protein
MGDKPGQRARFGTGIACLSPSPERIAGLDEAGVLEIDVAGRAPILKRFVAASSSI